MEKEYPYDCYQEDGTLIDPGKGYRLLKTLEPLKEGDEYFSDLTKDWTLNNFDVRDPCNSPVRRKLENGILEEYETRHAKNGQYKFVLYKDYDSFKGTLEGFRSEGWKLYHTSVNFDQYTAVFKKETV